MSHTHAISILTLLNLCTDLSDHFSSPGWYFPDQKVPAKNVIKYLYVANKHIELQKNFTMSK